MTGDNKLRPHTSRALLMVLVQNLPGWKRASRNTLCVTENENKVVERQDVVYPWLSGWRNRHFLGRERREGSLLPCMP